MWIRLRQIALVARELQPVIDDLQAVLGIEPCYIDPGVGVFGLENTLLPIGNQFLEVVAPTRDGTAGGRYLDRRGGDGGYMVITQTNDHAAVRAQVEKLGVRVAWGFDATHTTPDGTEEVEYRCMQLHPRDTGATFFEIDGQGGEGAFEPDGPWHPAGPNWQRVKNTEVTLGIVAAELQVDDPGAVATRWGEIAMITAESDPNGHPSVTLDNALLRFVSVADGRGEGLGAIDVLVASAAEVRARAENRGCVDMHTDGIVIGGLRINLIEVIRPTP